MSDPERRRHFVYVTNRLEYHVKEGVCVAVRERGAAVFLRGHLAIGERVVGAVCEAGEGRDGVPGVGEGLRFSGPRGLVTPPVRDVTRPTKATAQSY